MTLDFHPEFLLIYYLFNKCIFDSVSVRVKLRVLKLFPTNHRGRFHTVEQILGEETEEFRTMLQFLSKDCGKDM